MQNASAKVPPHAAVVNKRAPAPARALLLTVHLHFATAPGLKAVLPWMGSGMVRSSEAGESLLGNGGFVGHEDVVHEGGFVSIGAGGGASLVTVTQ